MNKSSLVLILVIFLGTLAHSQSHHFINYTIEDGLPSNIIYRVFQDKKGFVWIASDAGVSRFNGIVFENYSTADGLSDNDVLALYQFENDPRVFMLNYSGEIDYFLNDSIYQFADEIPELKDFYLSEIAITQNGALFFSTYNNGIIRVRNGKIETVWNKNNKAHLYHIKGNEIWAASRKNIVHIADDTIKTFPLQEKSAPNTAITRIAVNTLGETFYYLNNRLYKFIENGPDEHIPIANPELPINWIYVDNQDVLWIGGIGRGIERITDMKVREDLLIGSPVSSFIKDAFGNFWISTAGEGLFFLPKTGLAFTNQVLDHLNNAQITAIAVDEKNRIWVGNTKGKVDIFEDGERVKTLETNKTKGYLNRVTSIQQGKNGMWVATDYDIQFYSSLTLKKIAKGSSKDILIFPDKLISASRNYLTLYTFDSLEIKKRIFYGNTFTLAKKRENEFWFGAENGLYLWTNGNIQYLGHLHPALSNRVSSIHYAHKTLYVAVHGNGIVIIKDGKAVHLTKKNGLPNNFCNDLFSIHDKAFAATNDGLAVIEEDKDGYSIRSYSTDDGIIGTKISSVTAFDKKELIIATDKHLVRFNPAKINNPNTDIPIYITELEINQKPHKLNDSAFTLLHNQNNITIAFQAILYTHQYDVEFLYRLKDNNERWTRTHSNRVDFTALRPGDYTFEVLAINKNDAASTSPATLNFTVAPPFWQTLWFILLSGLIILILIGFSFWLIISRIKKREKKKTLIVQEINNYKLKALQAQLNPHFIFNCLGAIQYLVIKKDLDKAYQYLNHFSQLLRYILDISKKSFISLNEEIKYLQLYLQLEQLRFENKFKFSIDSSNISDTKQVFIPTMILQPYVENAVKHGFIYLDSRQGELSISFNIKKGVVECIIEDNGIGIKSAERKKNHSSDNHKSYGMELIKKRLEALSFLHHEQFFVEVIDKEEKYKDTGTIIRLFIPRTMAYHAV